MKKNQLSRLLDAEIDSPGLEAVLVDLTANSESRETITVYQIIGDALRGRAVEDDGYSRRIIAALAKFRG